MGALRGALYHARAASVKAQWSAAQVRAGSSDRAQAIRGGDGAGRQQGGGREGPGFRGCGDAGCRGGVEVTIGAHEMERFPWMSRGRTLPYAPPTEDAQLCRSPGAKTTTFMVPRLAQTSSDGFAQVGGDLFVQFFLLLCGMHNLQGETRDDHLSSMRIEINGRERQGTTSTVCRVIAPITTGRNPPTPRAGTALPLPAVAAPLLEPSRRTCRPPGSRSWRSRWVPESRFSPR